MKDIILQGSQMQTRTAMHDHLAAVLPAPDYYGRNLDALWDVLSSGSWRHITLADPDLVAADQYRGLMQLLVDWSKLDDSNVLSLTSLSAVAGDVYRHFKGGRYRVEGLALDSADLKTLVVYQPLYMHGPAWTRPLAEWRQHISREGYDGPRFVKDI